QHPRLVLGLLPSPGHREEVASGIKDDLPHALERALPGDADWSIEIESDPLTGSNVDYDDMFDGVERHKQRSDWSYAIALTDLPIRKDGDTLASMGRPDRGNAIVSIPALGVIRLHRRTVNQITMLVSRMAAGSEEGGD